MAAAGAGDAQKRKLETGAPTDSPQTADGKRPASVPDPSAVKKLGHADFSPELLRIYYERLFPFVPMYRWLSYRNDPSSSNQAVEKDYFLRREFTFVLAGDIYCRYQCFRDADEYRAKVLQQQPVRMEIGAVFTHPPKNHTTVIKDAYKPVERELVFDIDMDDYDSIRTCCTGSNLCSKCWVFMKAAIRVLERALRDDFGFRHILFVFSGRRGVHCWVCDKTARRLTNEQRSAVAEYLNMVTPGANKTRAELRLTTEELHPAVEEAHAICERFFRDGAESLLRVQDMLRPGGPLLLSILDSLGAVERDEIEALVRERPGGVSSVEIWSKLEKIAGERAKSASTFRQQREAKTFLKDIVIQLTYPRLDINVSKQMNHLLKSPFVVHPKSGRVCVPIDPRKLDEFNPLEVPTLGRLVSEINADGVRDTSLRPYVHFFEASFLKPLETEELKRDSLDF